ncbi:MAG: hypothetical protein IJ733_07210 [Lachnospiraceae bacterium]|nr:hypothetical protein [Lachnospiraceae bacterium]
MTAIKEEAIRLMEQVPDSLVQEMMAAMRNSLDKNTVTVDVGTKTRTTASVAFNNFLSYCKKSTLFSSRSSSSASCSSSAFSNSIRR